MLDDKNGDSSSQAIFGLLYLILLLFVYVVPVLVGPQQLMASRAMASVYGLAVLVFLISPLLLVVTGTVGKGRMWQTLRYASYVGGIIFLYLLFHYLSSQRLLSFWIAFFGLAVGAIISLHWLLGILIFGQLTGLDKPYARAKRQLRNRLEELVEELDEEIEESG